MIERLRFSEYLQRTGQTRFTNAHGSVVFAPEEIVLIRPDASAGRRYQETVRDVSQVLGDALAAGKRLRCLGRRWSLSPIAATEGWLLDLSDVATARWLAPADLHPNAAARRDLAHLLVAGGTSVRWINWVVHRAGWSLQTTGASNGQAIAGAIATGTHGSSFRVGALHDTVAAIHVVVGPTEHWWVESENAPVAGEGVAAELGAKLVRDSELFRALLTSLGSLGIVVGVVLRCVPSFWLELKRYKLSQGGLPAGRLDTAQLVERLAQWRFDELIGQPLDRIWHLDVVFNPYAPEAQAYLNGYVLAHQPPRGTPGEVTGEHRGAEWNPDVLQFVGRFARGVPGGAAAATSVGLESEYERPAGGPSPRLWGDWFRLTATPEGTLASSVGVDCAQLTLAMRTILDTIQTRGTVPMVVATRFVRDTSALLGMNQFERTCMIDIDGSNVPGTTELVTECCDHLRTAGVRFTMHWGKWNGCFTREHVAAAYGDKLRRWREARAQLLGTSGVAQAFWNPLTEAVLQ